MRINFSFGGGPRRYDNRNRHYGRHTHGVGVSVSLGPVGSAVVSFIAILFLSFITFIFAASGVVIGAAISGVMDLIFIFVFINNIKKIRNGRD